MSDTITVPRELAERTKRELQAAADRIAALEAKVRELEVIDAARTSAVQDAIDNAAIYQDQLTASRQQVERLVETLQAITMMAKNQGPFTGESFNQIAQEALSAIEQYTKGRKS